MLFEWKARIPAGGAGGQTTNGRRVILTGGPRFAHDKLAVMITERLKQAVERAASVLQPEEQDQFADKLLAKLAKEEKRLTGFVHDIVNTLAQLMNEDDDAKWVALFA